MQVPEYIVSLYVATCGQNGAGLGSDEKEIILLIYVILDPINGQIIGVKQVLVRPDGSFVKDRSTSTSSDTSQTAGTGSTCAGLLYADNTNFNVPTTPPSSTVIATINNNNNVTANGPTSSDNIELPVALAQAAGKPLNEAIVEFDEYLRSLSHNNAVDIKLITDGQLPLRQCLHREACVKDMELPAYYNQFCDLRKEFLKYKSGDLSRALVPVKDIKKILQIPTAPTPQSIGEMMKELNLPSTEDTKFYVKESRDMVSIVQTLLNSGHKFIASEVVNLVLEPGICSIDDEIDGNCIVRARGLPWQSSDQDIAKFFRGLNVAKGGVALCLSPLGRRNGEALIRFVSQEHRDMALKRHKHHIGNRYIEVYRATGEDFLAIAGGASNEAQAFLSKGAQVIIRMRGLPYDCSAKQVLDFFTNGESPCNVLDSTEGVLFVKKPDGRATGDAFVLFASESDAPKALSRHRESIGQRYIELFRSTTAEVQQVLNRSMDPKTYESNHQPPLIAQLPTMQLSLMPQHFITSGTSKNCIRLRGLPYEALVEHILHFLDDFAKHIIFQGVHMVINAQGQPSGEAFIQMDSEESARLCAQRKHNHFMVFGKKYRYIEVFQCSGDDMNMVLNGGLQSPVTTHHTHHPGSKQPSLLSPGASVISASFGPFAPFGPPTPLLSSTHRTHAAHHPHISQTAFYQHPFIYWPYPSPPVSPTTYFNQPTAHSPSHLTGQHQAMYSLDFLAAVTPTNLTAPMSPPSVAIPPTPAGIIISPNKAQSLTMVPSPKQFSPLSAPVPVPYISQAAAATNFHNKIPIPYGQPQQQVQRPPEQLPERSNGYHLNGSSTAPAVPTPSGIRAEINAAPIGSGSSLPVDAPSQLLLSIDTTLVERTPHVFKSQTLTVAKMQPALPVNLVASTPVSTQGLVSNKCVELFIS